jgi:hypothetical protein
LRLSPAVALMRADASASSRPIVCQTRVAPTLPFMSAPRQPSRRRIPPDGSCGHVCARGRLGCRLKTGQRMVSATKFFYPAWHPSGESVLVRRRRGLQCRPPHPADPGWRKRQRPATLSPKGERAGLRSSGDGRRPDCSTPVGPVAICGAQPVGGGHKNPALAHGYCRRGDNHFGAPFLRRRPTHPHPSGGPSCPLPEIVEH